MALNSITVKKLAAKRQAKEEAAAMKKIIYLPAYYEVYSGILNYRTGIWDKLDPVDIVTTLTSAREELHCRQKHYEHINAAYIVRRYRHGRKVKTGKNDRKAVEKLC